MVCNQSLLKLSSEFDSRSGYSARIDSQFKFVYKNLYTTMTAIAMMMATINKAIFK